MQPTNLSRLQIQYGVSTGSCRKQQKKSVYFPYIDSDLGYFALNSTFGLRIKEFPLYGTDNYYKMVGKKSMQKFFFPGREISVREKSVVGDIHCTTIQNTYVTEMICSNFTPISHCTHFQPQKVSSNNSGFWHTLAQ